MKVLRWVGNTFIVAGATLLFFVVYELVGTAVITNHHQSALAAEWDEDLLKGGFVPTPGTPSVKPKPKYVGPPPLARLIIPKINFSKFVVEGVSLARLSYGPGHYPKTPLPGHVGTTAMACHRTGWGSPCINLDKVGPGDDIILETKAGCAKPPCRFVYRVTHTKIVEASDGWVLDGDPASKAKTRLTLTTCTPKYTSLHRLILWADLVSPAAGIA